MKKSAEIVFDYIFNVYFLIVTKNVYFIGNTNIPLVYYGKDELMPI